MQLHRVSQAQCQWVKWTRKAFLVLHCNTHTLHTSLNRTVESHMHSCLEGLQREVHRRPSNTWTTSTGSAQPFQCQWAVALIGHWPETWPHTWSVLTVIHTLLQTIPVSPAGSQADEAIRTTSCREQRCNPQASKKVTHLTLTLTWNVKKRTGDKGQLWHRSRFNGNLFDFVPRTQTQISLWLYRDWRAHSNEPGSPHSDHMAQL